MKKKVLACLAGSMLISSVALAAPPTELEQGKSVIGLYHLSLDESANGFFLEHGMTDKLILGLQHSKFKNDGKETDFYGKFNVSERMGFNANLLAGIRDYSGGSSKFTLGFDTSAKLSEKLTGYAGLKTNSVETEFNVGVLYPINQQLTLDLNYTNKDYDIGSMDGFGFGLNYKF